MTLTAERSATSHRPGRKEVVVDFATQELRAPFALRCGALCIDYIVLIAVPVITLLFGVFSGGATNSRTGGVSNSTGWLLGTLLCLTNFFILPTVGGQSIGKMLTGLRIVKMDGTGISFGTVILRNLVGYFLTVLTLGIGFLFAALGKNGRALHDLVAGTVVVYAKRTVK